MESPLERKEGLIRMIRELWTNMLVRRSRPGRLRRRGKGGHAISTINETLDPAGGRRMRRRSAAGKATEQRLRQVALDLFWKKGYQGTTTRDVAANLGVQQASLYFHMKNKEELLHG